MLSGRFTGMALAGLLAVAGVARVGAAEAGRHPVPKEHPRLFGSREDLEALARRRSEAYQRMVGVARQSDADDHSKKWLSP